MELETINKLFLELSHVANATTAKELALQAKLNRLQDDVERLVELASYQALDLRDFSDNSDRSLECWRSLPENLQTAINAKEIELDFE